jgi:hypothetical protein
MYKIFKGFANVATCNSINEVKSALVTIGGGMVNVLTGNGAVYSAYHFEAGEVAHGWV